MPSSNTPSLDDLISHIVAGLYASQSLHLAEVENLLRLSLLELGQSIAQTQATKQKPRKTKTRQQPKPVPAPQELSVVGESHRETIDIIPRRSDVATVQRPHGHSSSPRRRLTSRRTGSRG